MVRLFLVEPLPGEMTVLSNAVAQGCAAKKKISV
jgi:hypothetical protein